MEVFIFWLGFSVIAAIIAANKGRSGFWFFVLSVVLSPLIGIIAALVVARDDDQLVTHAIADQCPFCSELIKRGAIVCKHCGRDIPRASAL